MENGHAEEELPNLQLSVREAVTKQNSQGQYVGTMVLVCVTKSREMFDSAVTHLDGYKMYGSSTEEMIDALARELSETEEASKSLSIQNKLLSRKVKEKDAEIERLHGLLAIVGRDLGLDD